MRRQPIIVPSPSAIATATLTQSGMNFVALSICFLLSDWSRHITGEILNINGGSVLCG